MKIENELKQKMTDYFAWTAVAALAINAGAVWHYHMHPTAWTVYAVWLLLFGGAILTFEFDNMLMVGIGILCLVGAFMVI